MSLPSSAMRSSNHASMGSNYLTGINQGGGSKKAGLYPTIGTDSWSTIFYGSNNIGTSSSACRSLKCMQFTANTRVRLSRPIGSFSPPNRYWSVR